MNARVDTPADAFELARAVGLALPDVEATTRYDGSPVLKMGGCFMAGVAMQCWCAWRAPTETR
jgi:hypothetical protein